MYCLSFSAADCYAYRLVGTVVYLTCWKCRFTGLVRALGLTWASIKVAFVVRGPCRWTALLLILQDTLTLKLVNAEARIIPLLCRKAR